MFGLNSEPAGCLTTATGSNRNAIMEDQRVAISRICSVDDCGKKHHSHGFCRGHMRRWRDHGDPMAGRANAGIPLQWLIDHRSHEGEDCLLWPFARNLKGYAKIGDIGAYRVMCELTNGPAPSPEHEAAHNCGHGTDACVHPKHLRWATRQENSADRIEHGTFPIGEGWYNAKLSASDVAQIRDLRGKMKQADIADMFGTSQSHVGRIQRGEARATN